MKAESNQQNKVFWAMRCSGILVVGPTTNGSPKNSLKSEPLLWFFCLEFSTSQFQRGILLIAFMCFINYWRDRVGEVLSPLLEAIK